MFSFTERERAAMPQACHETLHRSHARLVTVLPFVSDGRRKRARKTLVFPDGRRRVPIPPMESTTWNTTCACILLHRYGAQCVTFGHFSLFAVSSSTSTTTTTTTSTITARQDIVASVLIASVMFIVVVLCPTMNALFFQLQSLRRSLPSRSPTS